MDNNIVEKIAREVMLKLKTEAGNRGGAYTPPVAAPTPPRGDRSGVSVYLVTANFKVLDQVLDNLSAIVPASARLVVSEYLYQAVEFTKKAPGREICRPGSLPAHEVIKSAAELVIPALSLNTLSKAANLVADSFATQVISYALTDGVPVIVTDESILEAGRFFPSGVAKKVDQLRRELESMGVSFRRGTVQIKPEHKCSTCRGPEGCASCGTSAPDSPVSSPTPEKSRESLAQASNTDACLRENCGLAYGSCVQNCEPRVREVIKAGADRVEKGQNGVVPSRDLARYIDHTLLKAAATTAEITKLCEEARQYEFASVCVNPGHVALSARLLRGSPVKVCTVVGFPLGATSTFTKVMETRDCIANGATEIDMVINVGALKAKDYELVKNDIARVVEASQGFTVKVIFETSLLTKEEIVKACELSKLAGADFVKTSTGFSSGGATVEDIALMRQTVGPNMGVKASGGVRDLETARKMIAAGATRIGASASVAIVKGEAPAGKGY